MMPDSLTSQWARPTTILVATDLSDLNHLMPFALEQASEAGARLLLLHVLSTTEANNNIDGTTIPYFDASGTLNLAEQMLQSWCEAAVQRGIRCDGLLREGHPAYQIAGAARLFHADRVLIGTRSQHTQDKMRLGSVAEQVLRSVYAPVITVGPDAHLPVDAGEDRVVLYATTLREASRQGASFACQAAAALKARLVLLHVLDPDSTMAPMETAAGRELRQLAGDARDPGSPAIEPVAVCGNPTIEILATAAERKASMIVLGASHQPAFESIARDRTAYRVLACARCPVLTLHAPLPAAEEDNRETAAAHQ